ncbi:MAG: ABC transporter permease [Acidobacteriota bacterium]
MRLVDASQVAQAVEALGRYKLRTALSVLGVVFGVAGVVAMTSVSSGARQDVLAQVERLGLDNVIVRAQSVRAGRPARPLEAGDADRLRALIPEATVITPLIERVMTVPGVDGARPVRVLGVRADYQHIVRLAVTEGRLLAAIDDQKAPRVCVLGASIARQVFGGRSAVGLSVQVGADMFTVIGVLAGERTSAESPSTLTARDMDEVVLMPIESLSGRRLAITPTLPVDELWVQVAEGRRVDAVAGILTRTLTDLRGVADLDVVVPRHLLAQHDRTRRTFAVVVGSVAVMALLVGGIGIMNVMLTSVMERTSEIGIRRTVGATRRHIRAQFLIESLVMTVAGGAVGILLGAGAARAISAYAGWHTLVSATSVAIAFVVSAGVGVTFGLYPAVQASALEPVEAVRYE